MTLFACVKRIAVIACVLGASLCLTGCMNQCLVPVASRTPDYCGNVKLYGTDNVPFEYEELAVLSQGYNLGAFTPEQAVQMFVADAQKVGADAIVSFKMEISSQAGGFWLVINVPKHLSLSGVAVKIKRP